MISFLSQSDKVQVIYQSIIRYNTTCSGAEIVTSSLLCETVERHVLHPVEMYKGGGNHQNVEYLMRLEPEVTFAGEEPLRDPGGVEASSEDVEAGLDEDPVHGGLHQRVLPSRHDQRVTRGNDAE